MIGQNSRHGSEKQDSESKEQSRNENHVYLVGVHVTLRSAASLPNHERKMIIQFPLCYFLCCLHNGLANGWIKTVVDIHLLEEQHLDKYHQQ